MGVNLLSIRRHFIDLARVDGKLTVLAYRLLYASPVRVRFLPTNGISMQLDFPQASTNASAASGASERPLVGASARMRIVHALIAKLARNNSTVLLTGESGTGKELAARSI